MTPLTRFAGLWDAPPVVLESHSMVDAVHVVLPGEGPVPIDPEAAFTFGRSPECDLVLDETDRSISRVAGRIEYADGAWFLVNASGSRPLYLIGDVGLRRTVPTGGREVLAGGETRVVVVGVRTHELLLVIGDEAVAALEDQAAHGGADRTLMPAITANERVALVAIAEGYLLTHPRHDPQPRTYVQAAERLGLPVSTVRKRLENVRRKLIDAGVFQIEGADARAATAEFALAVRLVTAADLPLLDAPAPPDDD